MNKPELTWKDIVRDALLKLGGQGHLSEINKIVEGHPKTKTNPTWRDTIRRVLRQYKIFEPIPPERSGIYKIVEETQIKPEAQNFTEKPEINHGIAQGMLITLGKIYGYETYAPPHDQTIRTFQGKPLRDFVTVSDCTDIFKGPNLSKIREIDTLWFNEDDYGLFPVYAFEVGECTVEFLLVAIELVAIQEKTNYPLGSLTENLYKDFGVKDRFSVIQKAVWRGK
jgi:hypothetical protein